MWPRAFCNIYPKIQEDACRTLDRPTDTPTPSYQGIFLSVFVETSEAFLNEEVVEFLGDSTEVFSRVLQGPSPDAWAFWFDLHVSGSIAGPGAYRICEESLTNHTRIPTGILLLLG